MSDTDQPPAPSGYADPPRIPTSSFAEREHVGRRRRKEIGFEAAFAQASSGITVWLVGPAGTASISPVAQPGGVVLDVLDVDDALPGPWEADVLALAREVAAQSGVRVVPDLAEGYRRAINTLAREPLHAQHERALMVAGRGVPDVAGVSAAAATLRLASAGDEPALLRDRVAKRWDAPVADALNAEREFAHYRETVAEPVAQLVSQYRVADAVSDETGRLMVLLARQSGDVILLEAVPSGPTPLESALGAWRHGSDLQRVLLARETLPLVPAEMLGWTTSADGTVARVWGRARSAPKGEKVDFGGRRRRARALGGALGLLHGRTGDAAMLSGFLGMTPKFGDALAAAVR